LSDDWTTRVLPELTRPYGVEELHRAWFVPKGWLGKGPGVTLLIPECELQICTIRPDGVPDLFVNRPRNNKKIKVWLRSACKMAVELNASLSFGCDTAEQAERAAKAAGKLLPHYERSALERMYDAKTSLRGNLN